MPGLSRIPRFSETFPPALEGSATTRDIMLSSHLPSIFTSIRHRLLPKSQRLTWRARRCWDVGHKGSVELAFLLVDTVLCTCIMCKCQLNVKGELSFSVFASVSTQPFQNIAPPQKNTPFESITFVGRITEEFVGETMIWNASGVWQNKSE